MSWSAHVLVIACTILCLWSTGVASAQESDPVWIYKDMPSPEETDMRSVTERTYQPHFIFPKIAADENRVIISEDLSAAADELGGEEDETVCMFAFRVGASQFAGVKFIPMGVNPGRHPGQDIARRLRSTTGTPVLLKFRARTSKGATAVVAFKTGGTSGNRYSDTLRFPESPDDNPARLTEAWETFEIDLTGKNLTSVICPLEIVVQGDDNTGADAVTVYVDDVRYEVGSSDDSEE